MFQSQWAMGSQIIHLKIHVKWRLGFLALFVTTTETLDSQNSAD